MIDINSMPCADINSFVQSEGDVNTRQVYLRGPRRIEATTSLLERAVKLSCVDTVRMLLNKGASLTDKSLWDYYVDVPAPRYRERLAPLWVAGENDFDGNQLLVLWSIFFGNFQVFHEMYQHFSPHKDLFIVCAMSLCVEARQFEMLDFLILQNGQHFINDRKGDYSTVFHLACQFQDIEMAGYLLQFGASPNIPSSDGDYPLTDAIYHQNEEVALFLIEHGADVNVKRKDRGMPLSMAKKRKLKRVVAAIQAK